MADAVAQDVISLPRGWESVVQAIQDVADEHVSELIPPVDQHVKVGLLDQVGGGPLGRNSQPFHTFKQQQVWLPSFHISHRGLRGCASFSLAFLYDALPPGSLAVEGREGVALDAASVEQRTRNVFQSVAQHIHREVFTADLRHVFEECLRVLVRLDPTLLDVPVVATECMAYRKLQAE